MSELERLYERLANQYGLTVPKDMFTSLYSPKPRLSILMSRAAFRPEGAYTTFDQAQRANMQRERRNFLRSIMALALVSVLGLIFGKVLSSPKGETPVYVSNPETSGGRVLTTARNVPQNSSLAIDDPTLGPILLIHLDNGQFVAYSSICTHAGCQVNFNPYDKLIDCPCHGAVFDPYNAAQVLAGPAPRPLVGIPIRYDQASGNIYLES